MGTEEVKWPARIADAIVTVGKGLTPAVIKAVDRLIGATVDIPAAWLEVKKERILAAKKVDISITDSVANEVAHDPYIMERAKNNLIRKEYRKQTNLEAVAVAALQDMAKNPPPQNAVEPGEDWSNFFQRCAEGASSDRMRDLWGRVLAGELRKKGSFSFRALRFLSEFSQKDAECFEKFARCVFGEGLGVPVGLMFPSQKAAMDHLEAIGLIATPYGVRQGTLGKFDDKGYHIMCDTEVVLMAKGKPNTKYAYNAIELTPLVQELILLIRNRNVLDAARNFAFAIKCPEIHECHLGIKDENGQFQITETLWT